MNKENLIGSAGKRIVGIDCSEVDFTIKRLSEFDKNWEIRSKCPSCKKEIYFTNKNVISGLYSNNKFGLQISLIRACHECGGLYFQSYQLPRGYVDYNSIDLTEFNPTTYPYYQSICEFTEEIKSLSPQFCKIYEEASSAESENYNEICGMGYRKALEFLLKDYLIHIFPEQRDDIEKEFLGTAIKRITDTRIQNLSKRCIWLGNDECHYIRKQEDYNIEDLKMFIKALLTYIESELVYQKAMDMICK